MGRKKKAPEVKLPKIEQLPSGAWHTRVLIDNRRVSITRETYEETLAEYLALKNRVMAASEKRSGKNITLEEAVADYIASKEGFLSPSTIAGYEKFKRNMMLPMMKRNIFAVTNDQWQAAIRAEHKSGKSPKYIKNGWMFFSACIVAAGADRPEVMLYPPEHNERAYLTPDEIDKFVDAVKGQPVEIPALLCLSSLRRSEILALTWNNVDLKNSAIYIKGATVRGTEGLVTKKQNKSRKSRRPIPIIPPLLEALKAEPCKSGPVVKMTGDYALSQVKKSCESAGITVVDLHGLRHSFASLAYHLGIPEMIAAEIGGWNDLSTMHNIYTHLAQKDIAKRSQDFCDWFSEESTKKRKLETQLATESKNA
jgi:integrase|nr:MAG TPA: Integrase [Caudoviricetes sp.]